MLPMSQSVVTFPLESKGIENNYVVGVIKTPAENNPLYYIGQAKHILPKMNEDAGFYITEKNVPASAEVIAAFREMSHMYAFMRAMHIERFVVWKN